MNVLLAFVAAAALLGASPPPVEHVGKTRMAVMLPAGDPVGSVIVIPGGSTLLSFHDDGTTSNEGNFVMRVRSRFVEAGFAIAYLEDPSDLRPAIARMRRVARPVFLLSTSNGTTVAAREASVLGADGPDGVVLTSTVTKSGRATFTSAASADVRRITAPVLFVHNRNDSCFVSPASGVTALMGRFSKGADVTRIDVTSDEIRSDPCDAASPHGYLGIEADVTTQIVAWMKAHGARESSR